MFRVNSFAQFSSGNGTSDNPYIITTATQLAQLATYVNEDDADNPVWTNKHYKLGNDIDVSDYQSGEGWTPIGKWDNNGNKSFKGSFDGDNKIIKGLKIHNPSVIDVGLFGCVEGGTVKNISILDVNISTNYGIDNFIICVGGIVGSNLHGVISNCHSTGMIISSPTDNSTGAGGVVGYVSGGRVLNCYSTSIIKASSNKTSSAGGVVGWMVGDIILNCYSTTDTVSAFSSNSSASAGGIAGFIDFGTNTSNCYSTCSVSASASNSFACAGGVVGYVYRSSVLNSYSTGSVSASSQRSYAGGVVGCNYYSSKVLDCAALNPGISLDGSTKYLGRVVGFSSINDVSPALSNNISFNNILNPDGKTTWENVGLDQLDGQDINIQSIYADGMLGGRFTAENGWVCENGKLPGLFGKTVDMPIHLTDNRSSIPNRSILQTLKVYIQNDILHVAGLIQGKPWSIYDLWGKIIYEDIATDVIQTLPIQINNGIYIVKSGDEIMKFMKN